MAIWVDRKRGNDRTGDGTKRHPYKTDTRAIQRHNADEASIADAKHHADEMEFDFGKKGSIKCHQ